ncbi:MAG: hypothetical protein AAFR93_07730, partial [Pseudomonadota bacterium]
PAPMRLIPVFLTVLLALGACVTGPVLGYGPEATSTRYTPPERSGLVGVRPYPTRDDVCWVIGENAAVAELLDDSATLVGCPKHEIGAMADLKSRGAQVVEHARFWTLLSVPG